MRFPLPLLAAIVTLAVLFGGCSDASGELAEAAAESRTPTGDTDPQQPDTEEPDDADGAFVDPEGTYRIELGPGWTDTPMSLGDEIEAWLVGEVSDGFGPNVNILTQPVAANMSVREYFDLSNDGAASFMNDFDLLDDRIVEGASGQELGLWEYTGDPGPGPLHFLAVVAVGDGRAVLATFTANEAQFAQLRDSVEPYLLTLERT